MLTRPFVFALFAISVPSLATAEDVRKIPPREGKTEEIEIFNGKDLTGWEGHQHFWKVNDGVIVGRSEVPLKVSTYLLTKQHFTDFRFIVTTKLVESKVHSGVAFWGKKSPEHGDPYTFKGLLVMFPLHWGMYDLYGRAGALGVDNKPGVAAGHDNDWNTVEILVQGNRVRVAANGKPIIDWHDPKEDAMYDGPIGLQLHSNNVAQENQFKDLKLTTFPKEDKLITVKE